MEYVCRSVLHGMNRSKKKLEKKEALIVVIRCFEYGVHNPAPMPVCGTIMDQKSASHIYIQRSMSIISFYIAVSFLHDGMHLSMYSGKAANKGIPVNVFIGKGAFV